MTLIPTLRRLPRAAGVAIAFLTGLLITSSISLMVKPLAPNRADRLLKSAKQRWCTYICNVLGVRIRQHGTLLPTSGLIVSNHISWLDIIVLGALGPFGFVSKYEVVEWPVVGYLASQTGTLFLRRGDRDSTRLIASDMTSRLRSGDYLVFFPEGTSTSGADVLRFHASLFQPALNAAVAVQAAGIAYRDAAHIVVPFVGDDEFLPHLWQVMALPHITVDVFFCEPVTTGQTDRKALSELTHRQIVTALRLSTAPS